MESIVVILVCTNPCVHQEHAYTFLHHKFVGLQRDHILATDLHEQPEATLPITTCDWFWLNIHLNLLL